MSENSRRPPARTSVGMLLLWGVSLLLLAGALTVAFLVLTRGGPQQATASSLVVDTPEISALDGAEAESPVEEGKPVSTPPADWTSVLADDVGYYRVLDYSVWEFSGHISATADQRFATNETFDVILGEEIVDASLVYAVTVVDQPAEGDRKPAWTVTMEFAEAETLETATQDLGCQAEPANMVAVVAGGDLLMLASLSEEEFCGVGFAKGRILWQSFYDDGKVTSEEAKAEAESVQAKLLGTDG